MNVNCPICSDLFSSTEEIFITPCGHVFHHDCLLKWIERSASCPQCRKKTTAKNIHRIYFNFPNVENITLDAETLQLRLDSTVAHAKELETSLAKSKEENERLEAVKFELTSKISDLQESNLNKNSTIEILKQRLEYSKDEVKKVSRLHREIQNLKNRVDLLQPLQDIVDSAPENVESIVRNVSDPQALTTYILFLKRALSQTESKKKNLQETVKTLQRDVQQAKVSNCELVSEAKTLKTRIRDLENLNYASLDNLRNDVGHSSNETLATPNSLKRKSDGSDERLEPSVSQNKIQKSETDSPYLSLKQSTTTFPIKKTHIETKTKPNLYILQKKNSFGKLEDPGSLKILKSTSVKQKELETSYNGLGGHSKCDFFPVASSSGTVKPSSGTTYRLPKKNKGLKRPDDQIKMDKFCSL